MTPQERELVRDLFERLAGLESAPRDEEAEQSIREGLQRAPHAVYPLVQTVLLQDEALRRADARIRALEESLAGGNGDRDEPRGFLDNMRDALFGQGEERRGSVPPVRPGGQAMGVPSQYRGGATAMNDAGRKPPEMTGRGGGSFLGTAAAAAAGVIGGSLLLDGIRSMMGGDRQGAFAGSLDQEAGAQRSPWSGQEGGSDLARQAGLDDVGPTQTAALEDDQGRGTGLIDASHVEDEDIDLDLDGDVGDFDGGGGDL